MLSTLSIKNVLTVFLFSFLVLALVWQQYRCALKQLMMNTSHEREVDRVLEANGGSHACVIPPLRSIDDFFNYGKKYGKMSCAYMTEMGGNLGYQSSYYPLYPYNVGAQKVCLDNIEKGNCTVLSFGIGTDPSFDLDIESVVGCKVYMLDPTVFYYNSKLPPRVIFNRLGLSNTNGLVKMNNEKDYWGKVDRYEGILQRLNLTNETIDYLKMDIDLFELKFFEDIFGPYQHLLRNVKQIGFQISPIALKKRKDTMSLDEAFLTYWEVMHRLECHGFDLFSFIPTLNPSCLFEYNNKTVSGCFDLAYFKRS